MQLNPSHHQPSPSASQANWSPNGPAAVAAPRVYDRRTYEQYLMHHRLQSQQHQAQQVAEAAAMVQPSSAAAFLAGLSTTSRRNSATRRPSEDELPPSEVKVRSSSFSSGHEIQHAPKCVFSPELSLTMLIPTAAWSHVEPLRRLQHET